MTAPTPMMMPKHGKKSPELMKHAFEGHLDAFLQHIIPSVHP